MSDKTATDLIEELEQLDRFIEGDDPGVVPIELLAERGIGMPASSDLDDEALHDRLWKVLAAMARLGMYVESTDHLSDRQLYDHLREDALQTPTLLFPDDPAFGHHIDIIGGFSEDDIQIYLRYYADDESRAYWKEQYPDEVLPKKETPPFDRDRKLPSHEERMFGPVF